MFWAPRLSSMACFLEFGPIFAGTFQFSGASSGGRWTRKDYEEIEVQGAQIAFILRQGEEGTAIGEACRKAGSTSWSMNRLSRGERIMHAHRSHFYQRSLIGGYTVYQIVGRVFALTIALIALAAFTLMRPTYAVQAAGLLAGSILVGILLWDFARRSRRPHP
jgi:hypothetical protein